MVASPSDFLGREHEIELIRRAVGAAAGPGPGNPGGVTLVEFLGPPGIGKTALMDVLADEARHRGLAIIRGAAVRAERDRPFGLLIALLDEPLSERGDRGLLDPFEAQDLGMVLPGLRSKVTSTEHQPDSLLISRAAGHALSGLAGGHRGVALMVDDLQWADEATVAVLGHLVRRGVRVPLLVGFAARAGTPLSSDIGAASRITMELGPLDPESAARIVSRVPDDRKGLILDLAGGNPFFLKELARAGRDFAADAGDGFGSPGQARWPPAVVDKILMQMDALSVPARLLAETSTVLADPFDVRLSGQLAGIAEPTLGQAIDELCDVGLVVQISDQWAFAFRHAIVATVVYESCGPGWRRECHARAAQLLRDRGSPMGDIARHLERSASPGDLNAVKGLTAAAQEVRALLPRTAARWYRAAVRLSPTSGPDAAGRAYLAVGEADCLIAGGEVKAARQLMIDWLDSASTGFGMTEAAIVATLVRAETWLGMNDEARTRVIPMLTDMPPGPSVERLALETLAMLLADRTAVDQARRWGESAASIAHSYGGAGLQFSVAASRAYSAAQLGDGHGAALLTDEAQRRFDSLRDSERRRFFESIALLGSVQQWMGRPHEALAVAGIGLQAATDSQNAMVHSVVLTISETAWSALGRFDRAAAVNADAEDFARLHADPDMVSVVLARRSLLCSVRGDAAGARVAAEEAEYHLATTRVRMARATVALSLASVFLTLGRPARARRILLDHCGGDNLDFVAGITLGMALEWLTESELATGELGQARDGAERAMSEGEDAALPLPRCWGHRAMASVLLAEGDTASARSAAERAVADLESLDLPVEMARSELILARADLSMGRLAEGKERMTRVLEFCDRSGAVQLAAQAKKHLRHAGVRIPPAGRPRTSPGAQGVSALSRREREVAQCVAEDLGNREIAHRMFISTRTVESHLRRIFLRLGVHSREAVKAAVREAERSSATPVPDADHLRGRGPSGQ